MTSRILEARHEVDELNPCYAATSHDVNFLALALCGEVGELANKIKKRWRDGCVTAGTTNDDIRDEIADIRIYLELIADQFSIAGEKLDILATSKLRRVADEIRAGKRK